ncbi:hypothetical protein BDR26DRAFT_868828 [Obelidium mucronatum]|nr:hypothetical protein BDR26DRAFT_868828 [Obelidium mucronatum]
MDDGKKRYHCRVEGCHKSFSTSGHLTRHAQNHSGVRKYRCDYPGCTSAFFRPDTLRLVPLLLWCLY